MLKNTKLWIALGLVPQYVLVRAVSQYPEFIEHYYICIGMDSLFFWGYHIYANDFLCFAMVLCEQEEMATGYQKPDH